MTAFGVSAIAAKNALVVFKLERAVILNMLREFPDVALQMIRILGRRLELTTMRLARAAA